MVRKVRRRVPYRQNGPLGVHIEENGGRASTIPNRLGYESAADSFEGAVSPDLPPRVRTRIPRRAPRSGDVAPSVSGWLLPYMLQDRYCSGSSPFSP